MYKRQPLEKEMQFVDAVLDRYQGQVVTLTFGAVSAAKFDSAALERLKQTYQNVTVADATIPAQEMCIRDRCTIQEIVNWNN